MHWYRWDGDALLLRLRVQPRARSDALDEPVGDALRVRLRAPPVDGKANAALVAFLAETFGVPRKQVDAGQRRPCPHQVAAHRIAATTAADHRRALTRATAFGVARQTTATGHRAQSRSPARRPRFATSPARHTGPRRRPAGRYRADSAAYRARTPASAAHHAAARRH